MSIRDDLIERCAWRRNRTVGPLSPEAYDELLLAVRENPSAFLDAETERALLVLSDALDAYRADCRDDDLLDDHAFDERRRRRLERLRAACDAAIAVDDGCADARLVRALASDLDADALTERLAHQASRIDAPEDDSGNAWSDPFNRPYLRLVSALARSCIDSSRFAMAREAASYAMAHTMDANDPLGARHTLMLACARLEDEAALGELEARFSNRESAWSHLSRVLLLYRLGRETAARRALRGFDSLCAGGSYALLRPIYVDVYLPERPDAPACSFEESLMAIREAEPIIADVPEFLGWCQGFDWLVSSARSFAERNDLEW